MTRLIALLLAAPTAALAHTGAHDFSSLPHFATQPDHLGMIALGLGVGCAVVRHLRAKPARKAVAKVRT